MIKVEAVTLEAAYQDAASQLECSVTELKVEVVQIPSKGFIGFFRKSAIIVAVKTVQVVDSKTSSKPKTEQKKPEVSNKEKNKKEVNASSSKETTKVLKEDTREALKQEKQEKQEKEVSLKEEPAQSKQKKHSKKPKEKKKETEEDSHHILNDTIMPASFVSMQDEEEDYDDVSNYLADYDEGEEDCEECKNISEIANTVKNEINELFDLTCFKIDSIDVGVHDENTLLIEFKGADAALLIGKEGYRYKALSYMLFNWLNTKYQVQLRLEIAEFLKNQEESISKYLIGVCSNIDRDGRAQTKILDGVLVQIALNELRDKYPDKYIVIRSTRDGLKYIIVNDYHSN